MIVSLVFAVLGRSWAGPIGRLVFWLRISCWLRRISRLWLILGLGIFGFGFVFWLVSGRLRVGWLRIGWFGIGRLGWISRAVRLLGVRCFRVCRLFVLRAFWGYVFGVFGLSFVCDVSGESGFGISPVLDDLLAAIGQDYVVRSGDHLAIALFLAAVVVVLVLDGVTKIVRFLGSLFTTIH